MACQKIQDGPFSLIQLFIKVFFVRNYFAEILRFFGVPPFSVPKNSSELHLEENRVNNSTWLCEWALAESYGEGDAGFH